MSLRIAFDLDGVLADMDRELLRLASEMFGSKPSGRRSSGRREASAPAGAPEAGDGAADEVPAADQESELPATLSLRQRRQLWQRVQGTENFWSGLNELEPGEIKRLGALVEQREWEVVFLTRRPASAGESTQLQSQRWLHRHGVRFPSVFVVTGSRGKIAAALQLDVVVDDRPENCLDVVTDSNARAILVWRGDMQLVPGSARRLGIGVVASVKECLDVLEEVDVMHARPPSVLERLKRRLGLSAES
ncbi:MAG: hypothetical protein HY654_09130 [Acidobacteria bacterium]|nr:hypothetical protein [Acidobacteriota bacterium]